MIQLGLKTVDVVLQVLNDVQSVRDFGLIYTTDRIAVSLISRAITYIAAI